MIKFKPNVLVILASYNGEKYIREQIISIINQKEVEINIHVFDDASDDKTFQIVQGFPEIILTKRSVGSGSAAINFLEALFELKSKNELIKYDYIAFADQDDIWLENKMSRSIHFLKKGYDLYGSNLTIYKNGIPTDEIVVKSHKQKKYDFLFEGGSAGCTYVFTPHLAECICANYNKIRYKTWRYFSHDWFIYFTARLNGLKTYIDKESNIYYRIHGNNVHGEMNSKSIKAYIKRSSFVFRDWYKIHSNGYIQFCNKESIEFKILHHFNKSYMHRLVVLFVFNFQLLRSKSKFLKFFLINSINFFDINKTFNKKNNVRTFFSQKIKQ